MIPFSNASSGYDYFRKMLFSLGFHYYTIKSGELVVGKSSDGTPFYSNLFLFDRSGQGKCIGLYLREIRKLNDAGYSSNHFNLLLDVFPDSDESLKAFAVFVSLKLGRISRY